MCTRWKVASLMQHEPQGNMAGTIYGGSVSSSGHITLSLPPAQDFIRLPKGFEKRQDTPPGCPLDDLPDPRSLQYSLSPDLPPRGFFAAQSNSGQKRPNSGAERSRRATLPIPGSVPINWAGSRTEIPLPRLLERPQKRSRRRVLYGARGRSSRRWAGWRREPREGGAGWGERLLPAAGARKAGKQHRKLRSQSGSRGRMAQLLRGRIQQEKAAPPPARLPAGGRIGSRDLPPAAGRGEAVLRLRGEGGRDGRTEAGGSSSSWAH
ncbi:UNVERIFIED_CONTAM: hypothetical protein K2H54_025247 [Gekko kuhli]